MGGAPESGAAAEEVAIDNGQLGRLEGGRDERFSCTACGEHRIIECFDFCPGCGRRIRWKVARFEDVARGLRTAG